MPSILFSLRAEGVLVGVVGVVAASTISPPPADAVSIAEAVSLPFAWSCSTSVPV